MTTIKEALRLPADRALTEDEIGAATEELRALCRRLQTELGVHAVAIIVAGEADADGHAHVFDASTVDFVPLSLFYATVAGSHLRYEQQAEAEENSFDEAARYNGIN